MNSRAIVGLNNSTNLNALFHTGGYGAKAIDQSVCLRSHDRGAASCAQIPRSRKEQQRLHMELKLFNEHLKAKIDEDKDKLEKARAHVV